jgi:hypothetical protein
MGIRVKFRIHHVKYVRKWRPRTVPAPRALGSPMLCLLSLVVMLSAHADMFRTTPCISRCEQVKN